MTPSLAGTPVIETARLTLRAPGRADWPAFDSFLASDRARTIRTGDYDPALAWRAYGHIIGHWVLRGFGMFVLTRKGSDRPLGAVGPWFPATWPEQEIGWMIWDAAAEGQGYAAEAAEAALAHAFGPLGWTTAVSYIAPENHRSQALARRLGAALDPSANGPGQSQGHAPCLVFRHSPGPRA